MVHFQYTHWVMNVLQILLHSVSIFDIVFHIHQIKIISLCIDFDNTIIGNGGYPKEKATD